MSTIRTTFFCVIMTLLVAGCGQVVTERLTTPQSQTGGTKCAVTKNVVVLPFVDYSTANDFSEASLKRNIIVMEAVTDQLSGKGYRLPAYEDTVKYLIDNNIVKVLSSEGHSSGNYATSVENELMSGDWSDKMKSVLRQEVTNQGKNSSQDFQGMDKTTIARIGSEFNADYIIRGRLTKYNFRTDKENWNPWKSGFISVTVIGTSRFLFGRIVPEKYDMEEGHTSSTWAGINNNNVDVHIRVWAQDPTTGQVVWTNRAEVKVTPQSSYADRNIDDLFHTAVDQAVTSLIDDFWVTTENYM